MRSNVDFRLTAILVVLFNKHVFADTVHVSPDKNESNTTTFSTSRLQKSEASKAVQAPLEIQINEENIFTGERNQNSHVQTLKKSRNATVSAFGGVGGFSRIRLRGARAFEPKFFLDGMPLQEIGAFSQYLPLIPSYFIAKYRIFPDSPPFDYSPRGISGAVDLQTCSVEFCGGDMPQLRALTTAGSYGYGKLAVNYSKNEHGKYLFQSTLDYNKSRENFPYLDNNRTLTDSSDDFISTRKNNDFDRSSAGFQVQISNIPAVGIVKINILGGIEKRGIPGMISAPQNSRMRQSLFVAQANTKKLWAESGAELQNQLGITQNELTIDSKSSLFYDETIGQKTNSNFLKSRFSVPNVFPLEGISAVQISHQHSQVVSDSKKIFGQEDLRNVKTLKNNTFNFSFHQDFVGQLVGENVYSLSFESGGSGVIDGIENQKILPFSVFGIQFNSSLVTPFLRVSSEQRRPNLQELGGGPMGLLANPSLKAEGSRKIEVGFFAEFMNLTIFGANDKNLIFLQSAGGQSLQYGNLEFGTRRGFDLSTDLTLLQLLNIAATYHWLEAYTYDNLGRKSIVPRSPQHFIVTEFATVPWSPAADHSIASNCSVHYQSEFFLDKANIISLKTRPTLDLGAQWRIKHFEMFDSVSFSFEANNVTDSTKALQSDIAGNKILAHHIGFPGFPEPGRRFYFTIEGAL